MHLRNGAAQSAPGTMSRITVRGARNSPTQRVKASLPCCQQVRSTLVRICCVRAPSQVRFPPHTLRAITMPRIARSAALLVASSPGQYRKVNSQGRSCSRWRASRRFAGFRRRISSIRSSLASSLPVAVLMPCSEISPRP